MSMKDVSEQVNKLLESEEWSFVSEVSAYAYGFEKTGKTGDWDVGNRKSTVSWRVDFEVRNWGIKEILPIVKSVEFFMVEENTDEQEEFSIADREAGWRIEIDYSRSRYAPGLWPEQVDIDFGKKVVTVTFQA